MTRTLVLLALLCLPALCFAEDEKEKKKRKPPPPPPPGIWWAQDFEAGLSRAAREGRPILFCINALDTESANLRLRSQAFINVKRFGRLNHLLLRMLQSLFGFFSLIAAALQGFLAVLQQAMRRLMARRQTGHIFG